MGLLPGLMGRRPSPGFTEKNLVEQVLLPGFAMPATRLDGLTHALLSPKPSLAFLAPSWPGRLEPYAVCPLPRVVSLLCESTFCHFLPLHPS